MKRLAKTDPKVVERYEFLLHRTVEELYDTEKDPHALDNLIDDPVHADVADSLRNQLEQWMVETGDYVLEAFRVRDDPDKLDAFMKRVDAEALKRAEIGVAMGINGTAVAKEAADMVLADDNFASISAAVEEGRRVYDNLAKSLAFILPTSLGQAMIILVAVLFFPVTEGHLLMPIEPVQILWVNLVVAIALALPLAFEAREPGLMERPPRPPNPPVLWASSFASTTPT